jgi:hypothetical protein
MWEEIGDKGIEKFCQLEAVEGVWKKLAERLTWSELIAPWSPQRVWGGGQEAVQGH